MSKAPIWLDRDDTVTGWDGEIAPAWQDRDGFWNLATGDLIEGPYLCEHCDCSTHQGAPCYTLNRAEFEARYDEQGRPRLSPGGGVRG